MILTKVHFNFLKQFKSGKKFHYFIEDETITYRIIKLDFSEFSGITVTTIRNIDNTHRVFVLFPKKESERNKYKFINTKIK